jgi:hypothetical protein
MNLAFMLICFFVWPAFVEWLNYFPISIHLSQTIVSVARLDHISGPTWPLYNWLFSHKSSWNKFELLPSWKNNPCNFAKKLSVPIWQMSYFTFPLWLMLFTQIQALSGVLPKMGCSTCNFTCHKDVQLLWQMSYASAERYSEVSDSIQHF